MTLKKKNIIAIAVLIAVIIISMFTVENLISRENAGAAENKPQPSTSSPSVSSSPQLTPSLSPTTTPSPTPTAAPTPTPSPSLADYQAQCQKDLSEAKTFDEEIRNITLPDANVVIVNQSWAIQTWGESAAAPDIVDINRTENVYKGLFIMPENDSLYQATVDWAGYFVCAVWNGQIYVVQQNFNPWSANAAAIFAHELTHIMQERYTIPPPTKATFDSDRARTALTEGDANFMEELFQNATTAQNTTASTSSSESSVLWTYVENPALMSLHPSLPNAVSDFDYFPYTYGPIFIDALYNKGGWALVDQAYSNPPNTTQQILQPEKYFQGINAQQVQAPTLSENGWTRVKTDSYGEYFIQVMLSNWIPENKAQTVAASWSGDQLNYYERGNEYLFTWKIQWNSTNAASAFEASFQNMMNATGATNQSNGVWYANGRYLTLEGNPNSTATTIVCSTNETSTLQPLT